MDSLLERGPRSNDGLRGQFLWGHRLLGSQFCTPSAAIFPAGSPLVSLGCCNKSTWTRRHRTQKWILSQFWRPEICHQYISRAVLHLKTLRKGLLRVSVPASGRSLACESRIAVFTWRSPFAHICSLFIRTLIRLGSHLLQEDPVLTNGRYP